MIRRVVWSLQTPCKFNIVFANKVIVLKVIYIYNLLSNKSVEYAPLL